MPLIAEATVMIASSKPNVATKGAECIYYKGLIAGDAGTAALVDAELKLIKTDTDESDAALPDGMSTTETDMRTVFETRPHVMEIAHRVLLRGYLSLP